MWTWNLKANRFVPLKEERMAHTIAIEDEGLHTRLRIVAAQDRTTIRAITEEALRKELDRRQAPKKEVRR